jgi:hypothetical protein
LPTDDACSELGVQLYEVPQHSGQCSLRHVCVYPGSGVVTHERMQAAASPLGKAIEPIVSVSIDFYIRVFVRVRFDRRAAQRACLNEGLVYHCRSCDTPYLQRLAQDGGRRGNPSSAHGPPHVGESCCGVGPFGVAGPVYIGETNSAEVDNAPFSHDWGGFKAVGCERTCRCLYCAFEEHPCSMRTSVQVPHNNTLRWMQVLRRLISLLDSPDATTGSQ